MSTIGTTTFEQRLTQATKFKSKFPNALPVVLQRDRNSSLPENLNNQLFLAPRTLSAGEFSALIRRKVCLNSSEALMMFVKDSVLVTVDSTIAALYERHSADDGFLYIFCTDHASFGTNYLLTRS